MTAGKGDKQRPTDPQKYRDSWERIFGKKQEEIITTLWMICALLAFIAGFKVAGWLFRLKAGGDLICSLVFAYKEAMQKHRIRSKAQAPK